MEAIVIGAAGIEFIALFTYLASILKGKTKPNLVTWILWGAAPLMASAFAYAAKTDWIIVLPSAVAGIGPFVVVITALLKKGAVWKVGLFDYICGGFSVLTLIIWLLSGNTELGIALAILSDLLAGLPTLRKAWTHPGSESYLLFLVNVFTKCTIFLVAKTWSFTEIGFTSYLIIINAILTGIIIGRSRTKRK